MNNLRVTLVCILIIVAGCREPAQAQDSAPVVLTVAIDGGAEYTSIQAAINAAPAGAVIQVGPGIYKENLKIEKPLKLVGAGWNITTIGPGNFVTQSDEELSRSIEEQMSQAKSDEQRAMIKTKFQEKYLRPTLSVHKVKGVEIRDLKLTSLAVDGQGWTLAPAIVNFRQAEASLSGCAIIGSQKDGIHVVDGSDVEISESLVAAVWGTGIVIGEKGSESVRVRILGCDVRNCHYAGIRILPGNDSTVVRRCRVSGAAWHGIRYDHASPTIVDNLIFANARCGIYASGKTAATIERNVLYKNEMTGMWSLFQNRDTIQGNTFVFNQNQGLGVSGACEPAVRRNIFFGHHRALSFTKLNDDSPYAKVEGKARLESNLFWENKTDVAKCIDLIGAAWEDIAPAEGTKTLVADPMFVSAEHADFSLKARSPARQEGLGVADPISLRSQWELQPEETAIIPTIETRDYRLWKKPGKEAPATKTPASLRESKPAPPKPPSEQKKQVDKKNAEKRKRIEGLIDKLNRTKAILADAERIRSLSDADKRLAQYKEKLGQITKQQSEGLSPDAAKKRAEEVDKTKQLLGDNWDHIYRQVLSAVRLPVIVETFDTDIEPFTRIMMMYSGNYTVLPLEFRKNIAGSLGINPYTQPDKFWEAFKGYLGRFSGSEAQRYRDQIVAKFKIPDAVVEHARNEVRKSWYTFGYQYFVDVFSEEKLQQTRKYLEGIEQKLASYPDWKKIEQDMFQSNKTE